MKIEYREATESELKFGAVDSLIDLVEIESCDIVRHSIGVEPESTGRGNEDLVIVARDMDNEGCVAGIVVLRNFLDMREPLCTLDDLYVQENGDWNWPCRKCNLDGARTGEESDSKRT